MSAYRNGFDTIRAVKKVAGTVLAILLASLVPGPVRAQAPKKRMVILGFDGVDAGIVSQMMSAGELPHLSALRAKGGFTPLLPPVPAQTPVSWSSFSTGLDPGATRIFDFLKRDPKTLTPTFAIEEEKTAPFLFGHANPIIFGLIVFFILAILTQLFARRRWRQVFLVLGLAGGVAAFIVVKNDLPDERPVAINNRQGEPFWQTLARAGKTAVVIRMPVTFPPEGFPKGELLSGLGVPDMSGRIGRPSFYTSDPFYQPKNGNDFSIELVRLDNNIGTVETHIVGPPAKYFLPNGPEWIDAPMTIVVDTDRNGLTVETSGQRIHLKSGEWSDWVQITFPVNALIRLHGMVRFMVESVQPEVKLYMSPVNFDPRALPLGFHLTYPAGYAMDLFREAGPYKTMGWAIDTWSLESGTVNEAEFLQDVDQTVASERKILDTVLEDKSKDLAVQYFEFPDRVSHMFWRFRDPKHPAYNAKLAAIYGHEVERYYRVMDDIVGQAQAKLSPGDILIVLSDHGFQSWRRSVNYDTWLVQNGYMVLKGNVARKNLEELFSHGTFWDAVDWSRTRAYAMGLGEIYINVAGREKYGIVTPGAQYDALCREIAGKLVTLTDPKTGDRAVSRVVRRDQIYQRFDPSLIPDLFALNTPGYRVSWQSSLGVPTSDIFEDNNDAWSGDHCSVDPEFVKGIFFASVPLHNTGDPGIEDVAPSVLALFGVKPPAGVEGKAFFGGN